ncbi:class I adenylate-forming enzyme family protein [Rhodococcus sp. DMU1]|uniref:class I adenylate-forming enzyme family protein n=1 Tax=Rhodococcus sp. DMU1 TaxID=2722825 RepID=UPI00143E871E|nr:class I adenylate-forming enzyme family protein [Rhodococcus sp. DMU1]QIX53754.1 acyl--CoA ligase [Rhodococcus sp. DMU1]
MTEAGSPPGPGAGIRPGWSYLPCSAADPADSFGTVDERFSDVARRYPERVAISWLDEGTVREVTWGELFARAGAVAAALRDRPLVHRRIGVLGRERVPWIVAMYGAVRAGCAIVPMPSGETPDGLAERCTQVGIDLLVTVGEVTVDCAGLPGLEVVDVHGLEAAGGEPGDHPDRPRADDEFLLQFTSGTTGRPKLAVLSHRAVLGSAHHYATAAGGTDGSVLLNPLPLEHVGGIVGGVVSALAVAGTYVAVGRFDPRSTVEAIRTLRPAIVGLVPTMVIDILALDGVVPEDFASVSAVVGGATSVDPELIDSIEQRLDTRFLVAYGQSEAPCLTMSSPHDPLHERTRTLGRPLPGRDYCVLKDGHLVAEGAVGELCVRGPLIMTGYLGAEGRPIAVCDENGWMRTGDLCSMRDGVITFHSRIREVVIRGGENLYPAEIESVISRMAGVAEVVVFGTADPRLGERLVAAVRAAAGSTVTEADLAEYAAVRLPRQKQPTEWFLVEDFPRTSTGKVRRLDLVRHLH